MNWLAILPTLIVALAIILVPGLLFGYLAGLRGIVLAGLAGPVSIAFLVFASLALPLLRLPWSPLPVLISVGVLAVALGLLFRKFGRKSSDLIQPSPNWRAEVQDLLIVLAGGAVLSCGLMLAVGNPINFNQAFDNVFHLNAIRFTLDEGSASPLTLGRLIDPDAVIAFYPSAWHGLNGIIVALSGASIPFANNAVLIAICLTVWPFAMLLLARTVFGNQRLVAVAVGIFVPAFILFPLHLLFFGPLMPMILGIALLPAALAVTLLALQRPNILMLNRLGTFTLLLGILAGIAVAHPGVLFAWLVAANLSVLVWLTQQWSALTKQRKWITLLSAMVFWAASAVILVRVQPDDQASIWGPNISPLRAFGEVLSGALVNSTVPIVAALFIIFGLFMLWRTRRENPAFVHLMTWFAGIGFLYFVAAAQPHGKLREILTGAWYQDPNRLGVIMVIPVLLLAAAGFIFTWRLLSGVLNGSVLVASLVVLCLLGTATWASAQVRAVIRGTQPLFAITPKSGLISDDELAMLVRLHQLVPEESVIAGNPWQGAGMAYAFGDRQVLMPHMFVADSADRDLILSGLNTAVPGSKVCDALDRQNVDFVLDFPGPSVLGSGKTFKGLENLENSSAVELIDQQGDAKLFKIIGCD